MTKILACIIACVCIGWISVECRYGQLRDNQEEIFLKLTNTSIYNQRIRPFNENATDSTLKIEVSLRLFGLASMDDLRSEYQVSTLMRLSWQDDRLRFNGDDLNYARTISSQNESLIVGDIWHAERVWIPSINVVNEKGSGSLNSFIKGSVLIQISASGNVLLSSRAVLRLGCNMKFHYYPLDIQTCVIELESSVLSEDNLKLIWSPLDPIKLDEFQMPGFRMTNNTLHHETKSYVKTGNFSHLAVTFHLSREFQHFLLEAYMPSALFVFTSWTSFFVDIQAAPARVTIGITSMLTLVTSFKSIREKLPRYSYISALDVWNFACTAFVFASLIEYAVVNFIYNKEKRKKGCGLGLRNNSMADLYSLASNRNSLASIFNISQQMGNNNNNINENRQSKETNSKFTVGDENLYQTGKGFKLYVPGAEAKNGNAHFNPSRKVSVVSMSNSENVENCGLVSWLLPKSPQDIANGIDKKCRFVFPVLFLIFNVIYWAVVITKSTIL